MTRSWQSLAKKRPEARNVNEGHCRSGPKPDETGSPLVKGRPGPDETGSPPTPGGPGPDEIG